MKVYTKTGDKGTTALIGGERVSKYDIRVEAYGTVDELSAFLALLGDKMCEEPSLAKYVDEIHCINSMLMTVESHLAMGMESQYPLPEVSDSSIKMLEHSIDLMQGKLPQIMKFTIPGGSVLNSLCHVCRTVCRRAERRSVEVAEQYDVAPNVVMYLNRLSDYLYLLSRTMSMECDVEEVLWVPEV